MYSYCCRVSRRSVADTTTVWRPPSTPLPVWSQILAMSRRKLLASRSSASSITRHFTPCVRRMPLRESSARRPGVPTTSSGFLRRRASSCLRTLAPPMHCCVMLLPNSPRTRSTWRTICIASSCEGTTTRQRTSEDRSLAGRFSSSTTRAMTGSKYAIVLPLPVCDCNATLFPANNAGMAARCGREGSSNPVASSAAHRDLGRPSSAKVGGASVSDSASPASASQGASSLGGGALEASSAATMPALEASSEACVSASVSSPDARVDTSTRNPRELVDSGSTVRGPRRACEGHVANRAAASWRWTNLARATSQGVRANSRAPGGARAPPKSVARVARNDAAAIAAPRARVVVPRALVARLESALVPPPRWVNRAHGLTHPARQMVIVVLRGSAVYFLTYTTARRIVRRVRARTSQATGSARLEGTSGLRSRVGSPHGRREASRRAARGPSW